MDSKFHGIHAKLESFTLSLLQSIQKEKEYQELQKQGKTWDVVTLDGTVLYKGVRGLSNHHTSSSEELRLFNQL